MGFKKQMVYEIPQSGGGKPYLSSGLVPRKLNFSPRQMLSPLKVPKLTLILVLLCLC